MPAIHLIERVGLVRRLSRDSQEYESGNWVVSEETAARLVGGHLFLHDAQDKPSRFGGRILGWRALEEGVEDAGRIVFRFLASEDHQGVNAGRDGWGNEKKLVW